MTNFLEFMVNQMGGVFLGEKDTEHNETDPHIRMMKMEESMTLFLYSLKQIRTQEKHKRDCCPSYEGRLKH